MALKVVNKIKEYYKSKRRIVLSITFRRFLRNGLAVIGTLVIFINLFMAIFAPYISPYDPLKIVPSKRLLQPSLTHMLGTDHAGRDILSRIIWGTREVFVVSLSAVMVSTIIGIAVGSISGYFGGIIDNILMRLTDLMMSLPSILLILVAVSMFKTQSPYIIALMMGILGWTGTARIVRSEFVSLKTLPYVESAKIIGASDLRIIFLHILPNSIGPIIVISTLKMASYIFQETSLTFWGLGDPTVISWGSMVNSGREYIITAPWIMIFSGLAIFILTLAFNLMGDGLRDALDIKQKV